MSEENDIYFGIGKECRRCGQLFEGENVVCDFCQDEIEMDVKPVKFFDDIKKKVN